MCAGQARRTSTHCFTRTGTDRAEIGVCIALRRVNVEWSGRFGERHKLNAYLEDCAIKRYEAHHKTRGSRGEPTAAFGS